MKNIDSDKHLRGQSQYLDDIPVAQNTLYVGVFESDQAHGLIESLDISPAKSSKGIVGVLTASDLPGENQIGGIIPDEPLLADRLVEFIGQPIALVYGINRDDVRKAVKKIQCKIKPLPVIVDEQDAFKKKNFLFPSRTVKTGDVDQAFKNCEHVFEGEARSGAQEHLYLETQGAYTIPKENGDLLVYSSTQGATAVQKVCAKVLGVNMNQIEVDVTRLGGGFGGKEDQANPIAAFTALGAYIFKRPTKLSLGRHEDMISTGKRHPYSSKFKIGLDKNLKIIAYEITFLQNSGAFADLSPAIMERTLFHTAGAYYIPNLKSTVHACKTNLPPNTAFRGFGAPQGMFAIESAIHLAAQKLGKPAIDIQKANFLQTGNSFHYGQKVKKSYLQDALQIIEQKANTKALEDTIKEFNAKDSRYRKELSYFPLCFGISFTKSHMNQASALIHLYQDGSIGVSTAAVEMGQGVNTKISQIVQDFFQIPEIKVKVTSTNTYRIANTSPTAASSAADLNGKAVLNACHELKSRLESFLQSKFQSSEQLLFKDKKVCYGQKEILWQDLILECFFHRVNLSAHAFYKTPGIAYDLEKESGTPFAYHVYGLALTEVTIDCLLGTYEIDKVHIAHDFGKSMNLDIDLGQIEGALAQGIGWVTMEDIQYDQNGRNKASTLSTYKIPDRNSSAKHVHTYPIEADQEELAILGSKAVGEPPFMYGIGTYFALQNALNAWESKERAYQAPMTVERLFEGLYH